MGLNMDGMIGRYVRIAEKREFLKMAFDGKSYRTRMNNFIIGDDKRIQENEYRVMFTQMQERMGMKKFGERSVAALVKELKQLNDGAVPGKLIVRLGDPTILRKEEKKKSFNTVTLIKEKRNRL